MAKIIPPKPYGRPDKTNKSFRAFCRVLRTLPDDFTAWLSLEARSAKRPHVFLVWRERHAFLIQVAETTQQLAESALQGDFFQQDVALRPEDLGRLESELLEKFVARSTDLLGPLAGDLPLKRLVVFPNVSAGTVDEVVVLRAGETHTSYLGLHQVQAAHFARRLEALAAAALPEPGLHHLRRAFTPESEVPVSFVARTPLDHNTAPNLPPGFLDFDQECCVKNDLELLPQQEEIVGEPAASVRLVTGVAGSGKSLVLLYRALLSARLHPEARVLVLTHNKPLRYELERRTQRLADLPKNLSCTTFFQWAAKSLGSWEEKMWWPSDIERAVSRIKESFPSLDKLSTAFLTDEIGWIKDHRLLRKGLYLEADRAGRGTSFRGNQREEMWHLFAAYQNELRIRGATDWHNIALRFHDAAVVRKSLAFPCYDAVFVDEAQFFAKAILGYARGFYESRRDPAENEADLNVPDDAQLAAITEAGEPPVVLDVPTAQDEIARAANEALALRNRGLSPAKLLVLHANSSLEAPLRAALERKLGRGQVHDAKAGPTPPEAFCSVTTLNAATGLEAPVVILLGVDALLESEQDPRLSAEERNDLRRDHTRMLYMGFTRAGQRLVVIRSDEGKKWG
jgi:hypothetical protein